MIERFVEAFPEAQSGNGHIVFFDCNVADDHLDFCLALELEPAERRFLELLRALPEILRVPGGSDDEWWDKHALQPDDDEVGR